MTFLMLTYVSEAGAAAYEETDADQQAADRNEHDKWFQEQRCGPAGRL